SFFLLLPRPRRSTLFPYTTLFRSGGGGEGPRARAARRGCDGAGERRAERSPRPPPRRRGSCRGPGRRTGRRAGPGGDGGRNTTRSEEHTSELQSRGHLVCRLLLEK